MGRGSRLRAPSSLFPEDSTKWLEESRLVKSARPDHLGTFEFIHVIPGDYFVTAADYVPEGEWADPAFLENLGGRAKRIRVNQDGAAAVTLTLQSER
jgi:hypothetical protein